MSGFFSTYRVLMALFCGGLIAYRFTDRSMPDSDRGKERFLPLLDPLFLVTILSAVFVWLLVTGWQESVSFYVGALAAILLQSSVYFTLLWLALPLLRRRYSAHACAALWLLPNVLYFSLHLAMQPAHPLAVFCIPHLPGALFRLWAAGAAGVLVFRLAQHVRFRRALLRGAYEPDEAAAAMWRQERENFEEEKDLRRRPLPLLISPHTATPLSIGIFRRTLRVVLPERDYAPSELRLIFRHELIHIRRQDARMKLFLTICTAAMWWNPLQWLAMRRCAEDLELSCDEFVLLDAPEETRRAYAALLLRTAGDGRGFTTYLSATAKALKYRLQNVLHPKRRVLGGLLLGVSTAALIALGGAVAIVDAPTTLEAAVFGAPAPAVEATLYLHGPHAPASLSESDAEALWEALRARDVYDLSLRYGFGAFEENAPVELYCRAQQMDLSIDLSGRYARVTCYYHDGTGRSIRREDHMLMFVEEPDWG